MKLKFFYRNKTSVFLKHVNIEKLLASKKIYFDEESYRYFFGYFYNEHKVMPLHIMLRKTRAYVKSYDGQTKWIYFLTENDDILQKYKTRTSLR